MRVDEKEEFLKKNMFTTEIGNVIIISCIICFVNARKYSEEIVRRLTFKCFEKVAVFSLLSSFTK